MKPLHIESKKEDIEEVVLMPGDPLRAKFIAETFLKDYKQINSVRNMLGYTGYYKGKRVTVMSHGMGIPSMAIYAYELYKFYDVKKIIRIGSVGSLKEDIDLFDVIVVDKSYTDSNFAKSFSADDNKVSSATKKLNEKIIKTANENNISIKIGDVFCSDSFYHEKQEVKILENCLGVEMESFALFHIATCLNKEAATILTVSNSLVTKNETTTKQREIAFVDMITLALESL